MKSLLTLITRYFFNTLFWGKPRRPEIETKESALLLCLEPGYYTIQLRSRSTATDGNCWIGIDDVTDQ